MQLECKPKHCYTYACITPFSRFAASLASVLQFQITNANS